MVLFATFLIVPMARCTQSRGLRGVQVSNYFPPVHLQPFMVERFGYKPGDFPFTDAICKSTIALPFHNHLTDDDIDFVCNQLSTCLDELT